MKFENEKIINIKLFNVNENYIEFNDQNYAIDAGIEIQLNAKTICYGWNFEEESFQFMETSFPSDNDAYELDVEEMTGIQKLIGKSIKSLEPIKTDFETVVDYTMKTERTTLVTGIEIDIDGETKVAISSCTFLVDPRNRIPVDILPDVQGNLLIDIGKSFH